MLEHVVKIHPELQISALLRSTPEGFVERYPSVSIIKGAFDDFQTIQEAAYDAEIVIRKTPKQAIARPLQENRPGLTFFSKIPETLIMKAALVESSPG